MKRISLFALAVALLAGLAGVVPALWPLVELLPAAQSSDEATGDRILNFDIACDCRTNVSGTNRGDVFIIQGKMFPAGTLPLGTATNDPTKPVNGVAPIGNWICRGQNSFPFPSDIASAYSSTPDFFNTQYFVLNSGRALTAEGYLVSLAAGELLFVTGGIRGFSGANGFLHEAGFGTNATGCPNFRARITLKGGSVGAVASDE